MSYKEYAFQDELWSEHTRLKTNTRDYESSFLGISEKEPILIIMDSLLRYAKVYRKRYDSPISEDHFASGIFLCMLKGCRSMFNMDGAVAMEKNITIDSKSNRVLENLYWHVMKVGGYEDESDPYKSTPKSKRPKPPKNQKK